MRLLLAVDDSEYSQAAVEQVATHFNPQTTEIKMLHCFSVVALRGLNNCPLPKDRVVCGDIKIRFWERLIGISQ